MKIVARQAIYDSEGKTVADDGDTIDLDETTARWLVATDVADFPPHGGPKGDPDAKAKT
jgi:hypothetical protein